MARVGPPGPNHLARPPELRPARRPSAPHRRQLRHARARRRRLAPRKQHRLPPAARPHPRQHPHLRRGVDHRPCRSGGGVGLALGQPSGLRRRHLRRPPTPLPAQRPLDRRPRPAARLARLRQNRRLRQPKHQRPRPLLHRPHPRSGLCRRPLPARHEWALRPRCARLDVDTRQPHGLFQLRPVELPAPAERQQPDYDGPHGHDVRVHGGRNARLAPPPPAEQRRARGPRHGPHDEREPVLPSHPLPRVVPGLPRRGPQRRRIPRAGPYPAPGLPPVRP